MEQTLLLICRYSRVDTWLLDTYTLYNICVRNHHIPLSHNNSFVIRKLSVFNYLHHKVINGKKIDISLPTDIPVFATPFLNEISNKAKSIRCGSPEASFFCVAVLSLTDTMVKINQRVLTLLQIYLSADISRLNEILSPFRYSSLLHLRLRFFVQS